jgi:hypothetical protein
MVCSMPLRTFSSALGLAALAVLVASCGSSAPSSAPNAAATAATTGTQATAKLDCTRVHALQGSIAEAQQTMVDSGSTTPQEISGDVDQIDRATRSLGALSASSLPGQTAVWVKTTDAYAVQIAGGARNGTEVDELLMDAHAFDSEAYQRAAKAVGTFFATACPG